MYMGHTLCFFLLLISPILLVYEARDWCKMIISKSKHYKDHVGEAQVHDHKVVLNLPYYNIHGI